MLKGVVGCVAVLVVAGSVQAQDMSHRRLTQADRNALTDARIGMAKAMLQMTPEQAKFWPPIEEAIRNGAEARYRRIAQLRTMMDRAGEREPDPIVIMRTRGEALSERGAQMKKLADTWQPLYQSLNPDQKDRMRLVASHVLHEVRGAMERRRMENLSEAEEGEDE
jgi:LTXXQ motif family protein